MSGDGALEAKDRNYSEDVRNANNLVSIAKRDPTFDDRDDQMDFDDMTEIEFGSKTKLKDFQLLKVVGRGAYGKVYQVKHIESGKIYAMKSMKKELII